MPRRVSLALTAALIFGFCGATTVSAANRVIVESTAGPPNGTGITIGVHIENDVQLGAMVVLLEFRTVSGGAYIAGTYTMAPSGRVAASGLMDFYSLLYYSTPGSNSCSGPVSSTWPGPSLLPNADGSPDASYFSGLVSGSPAFAAGADPAGDPSFLLMFDVNGNPGTFEIDTCCALPANHLVFLDRSVNAIIPSFTKGLITIEEGSTWPFCNGRPEDVNCDGVVDVLDVVQLVGVAFREAPESASCCSAAR